MCNGELKKVIEQLIAIVELMYFSLTWPATLIKLLCLLVRGALPPPRPPLLPKGLANPPFIPESYSPASVLSRLAIPGETLICLSL